LSLFQNPIGPTVESSPAFHHRRLRPDASPGLIRPYAFEWGERVLIFGGDGRLGQVTPPA
jgi:hypothetical protein